MRYGKRCLAVLALASVTACGSLVDPFEGVPPLDAPPGIAADSLRIAICYNKMFSTPEQVRTAAAPACGPNTEPQLIGPDMKLYCPVLTPVRAHFLCAAE
jgi:hypothetical protein